MRHPWLVIIIFLLAASVLFILSVNQTQAPTVPVVPVPAVPQKPVVQPASKDDLIVLDSPLPGAVIASPLTVTGKARGNWYFEGSFPFMLVDWDGKIIAKGIAKAQGDWMTTDYVPFTGTLTFTAPDTKVSARGSLILKKDNPSGDPKKDNALEVQIMYN